MLGNHDISAVLAVKNMETAKKFYQETLGLSQTAGDDEMGILYKTGNSSVLVYPSQFAGTNKATAAGWLVGDELDKIVADLKTKGVKFEQYDNLPGTTREGDIHIMGEMRTVWFKDPDGNILNLANEM